MAALSGYSSATNRTGPINPDGRSGVSGVKGSQSDQLMRFSGGSPASAIIRFGHRFTTSIDKLFSPLPRIVRDLAQDLGKKIRFATSGGEVELDREMMENIRDPLIHIVRNAIDHGIEGLNDRVAAGKDVTATIAVSARQSGNQIEIEVRDDGRGL